MTANHSVAAAADRLAVAWRVLSGTVPASGFRLTFLATNPVSTEVWAIEQTRSTLARTLKT